MRGDPLLTLTGAMPTAAQKGAWGELGFKMGDKGAHTSRTIMLSELSTLLRCCKPDAARDDYITQMVDNNCLHKDTLATRRLTMQRMSELFGLDPAVPLFRLLRVFWQADEKAHPMLALFTAFARDPLLRVTAPVILNTKESEELARQQLTNALRDSVEHRLNDSTLDKVVRNASSSWTQSGHLEGRARKKRIPARATPVSTTYALLLGYLLGLRGQKLFQTIFARLLDKPEDDLAYLAMDAKRLGFIDIKSSGGMLNISFDAILTENERRLAHGTD